MQDPKGAKAESDSFGLPFFTPGPKLLLGSEMEEKNTVKNENPRSDVKNENPYLNVKNEEGDGIRDVDRHSTKDVEDLMINTDTADDAFSTLGNIRLPEHAISAREQLKKQWPDNDWETRED